MKKLIGVLALQGDFEAHEKVFQNLGADTRRVRLPLDLEGLDALVLPGGESSTMLKLLDFSNLKEPLAKFLQAGLPTFSTCAGVILLAQKVEPDQFSFGSLPVSVSRNAWGRQIASFEVDEAVKGLPGEAMRMVFIRAPKITEVGEGVEVLASVKGEPVLVKMGKHFAMSFHPEIGSDFRLQSLFLESL